MTSASSATTSDSGATKTSSTVDSTTASVSRAPSSPATRVFCWDCKVSSEALSSSEIVLRLLSVFSKVDKTSPEGSDISDPDSETMASSTSSTD